MKISDSIYFDGDSLLVDKPTKIIYTGSLCHDEPQAIYMHCGYGALWENLQEIRLVKGSNGYEGDITFLKNDIMFFCFRTSDNKWDNNNGANYTVNISNIEQTFEKSDPLALIEMPRLKKGYLIKKKIKITFYKVIVFIGKLFSGKIIKFSKEKGDIA